MGSTEEGKSMRQFDFYEFTGVITPGVVILVAASFVWPDYLGNVKRLDVSLGGLGLAVMIAYVAGHLLQALGNLLEDGWWRLVGGKPSDWPRSQKHHLLADAQQERLQEQIRCRLGLHGFILDANLPAKQWQSIFQQVYAAVWAENRQERAFTFLGNYGMFRGVAAAALVAAVILMIVQSISVWPTVITFLSVMALAIYRMHRFAVHYARETFVQFLQLPSVDGGTK